MGTGTNGDNGDICNGGGYAIALAVEEIMDTLKQTWEAVIQVWGVVSLPAGIAMLLSVFVVQTAKSFHELSAGMMRILSFIVTVALFLGYCWFVRLPVRDTVTVGNALVAGVCGPLFVFLLKKYSPIDPDLLLVPKEDKNALI